MVLRMTLFALALLVFVLPIVTAGSIWSILTRKNQAYQQALMQLAPNLRDLLIKGDAPVTVLLPGKGQQEPYTKALLHYTVLTEAASIGSHIVGPRRFRTFLKGGEDGCILPANVNQPMMFNMYGKELYFAGVRVKELVVASNGRGCVAVLDGPLGVPGMGTEMINTNSLLPEIIVVLQKHIAQHKLSWDTGLPQPLTIFAPRRNAYWNSLSARLTPQTREALLLAHVSIGSLSYSMNLQNSTKLHSITKGLSFDVTRSGAGDVSVNGRRVVQFDAAIKYGVAHVVERPLVDMKELAILLMDSRSKFDPEQSTNAGSGSVAPATPAYGPGGYGPGYGNKPDGTAAPTTNFDIEIQDVADPNLLVNLDEGLDIGEEAMGPPLHPFSCSSTTAPDDVVNIPALQSPNPSLSTMPPSTSPLPSPTNTTPNCQKPVVDNFEVGPAHDTTPANTNCPNSQPTIITTYSSAPYMPPTPANPNTTDQLAAKKADPATVNKEESGMTDLVLKGVVIAMLSVMGIGGIGSAVYLVRKSRRPIFHHRVHASL